MLLINNSVAFMATGASDYMGYTQKNKKKTCLWSEKSTHLGFGFSLPQIQNGLSGPCVVLNYSVLDLFFISH